MSLKASKAKRHLTKHLRRGGEQKEEEKNLAKRSERQAPFPPSCAIKNEENGERLPSTRIAARRRTTSSDIYGGFPKANVSSVDYPAIFSEMILFNGSRDSRRRETRASLPHLLSLSCLVQMTISFESRRERTAMILNRTAFIYRRSRLSLSECKPI